MRRFSFILLSALFLAGCATIMHGSEQEVSFNSNPSQADVTINGQDIGQTPVVADLDRGEKHSVEIALDGYEPYQLTITKGVSGWVAGNLVFGGLIGLVVDATSGGMYKLSPDEVQADLKDRRVGDLHNESDETGVYVKLVKTPRPDWEKLGELTPSR